MTLGGRKIAPDALLGFHTADELGAVVDAQSGEVINGEAYEFSSEEPATDGFGRVGAMVAELQQSEEPERQEPKKEELKKEEEGEGNGSSEKPHWIEDERVRKRFWTWTDSMALSNAEVHEALDVEHVADYRGSMLEAREQIIGYVNRMATEEPPEEESDASTTD